METTNIGYATHNHQVNGSPENQLSSPNQTINSTTVLVPFGHATTDSSPCNQLQCQDNRINIDGDLLNEDFLPLCDLLFNIISLAAYFCNIVFDCVTVYMLYIQKDYILFCVSFCFVLSSVIISQIFSFHWYFKNKSRQIKTFELFSFSCMCVFITHVLQLGVLWRYFKLFIPVDLTFVKYEVRELCVLRMIHAFCEAGPMLLLQVYLMWIKQSPDDITDLNIISTFLSLFNVCWALSSFSKNVRRKNMHKLVLTWLGVIFQFLWRLGTVSSRIVALSIYARFYQHWVVIVILLHWFSMFLWLLTPNSLFHGERMSYSRRIFYTSLVAWVYNFCYINLHQKNARSKMIAFYGTMLLENSLLLFVCIGIRGSAWYSELAAGIIWGGFAFGVIFMLLYYKFFHICHLKNSLPPNIYDSMDYAAHNCPEHGSQTFNGSPSESNVRNYHFNAQTKLATSDFTSVPNCMMSGIPGVFNCRLNPALKRKKKKPTSFIPPPHSIPVQAASPIPNISPTGMNYSNPVHRCTTKSPSIMTNSLSKPDFSMKEPSNHLYPMPTLPSSVMRINPSPMPVSSARITKSPVAFLSKLNIPNGNRMTSPINVSDQDGSGGSRVNIQQKLQEKKQQQLMQLREIEEEIKQGKLKSHPLDGIEIPPLLPQSVPPQAKKQPLCITEAMMNKRFQKLKNGALQHYYYHPGLKRMRLRSQTPEVLLAPHYLDKSRVYYDYPSCVLPPPILSRLPQGPIEGSSEEEENVIENDKSKRLETETKISNFRSISDLESQVSFPRSYTLPRNISKYRRPVRNTAFYRRPVRATAACYRRPARNTAPSNKSSDGDVDSD